MDRDGVFEFIGRQRLAVLSTVHASGGPESALVGIGLTAAGEIVFDTSDRSRKVANLRARPAIALVVGWEGEVTVQIEGTAHEPQGDALAAVKAAYFRTWPECRAHETWPDIAYFVVTPTWMRYSDFLTDPAMIEFDFRP